MAFALLANQAGELVKKWKGIDEAEKTQLAANIKQYAESFLVILGTSSRHDDELLFEALAQLTGLMVKTLWSFAPAHHIARALPLVDPWPVALSGHPDFSQEWETKKELIRASFKKSGKSKQRRISSFDLPPSRSALVEIISAVFPLLSFEMPPVSLDTLSAWQKAVIACVERHPDFPDGGYFQKVNRGPDTFTRGQRADEIRKAIREYFRTLKRKLEAGE
jgi:hypothetical protein